MKVSISVMSALGVGSFVLARSAKTLSGSSAAFARCSPSRAAKRQISLWGVEAASKCYSRWYGRTSSRRPMALTDVTAASNSASASAEDNPLMDQEGLPKFAAIEPKHLTPAVGHLLDKMEMDFAQLESRLESSSDAKQESVLADVERLQFGLGYVWGVASHLNGVRTSDELRQAYDANQAGVVKATSRLSQSKPLYDALTQLQTSLPEGSESSFLESQRRRAIEGSIKSMMLGGVGLEGADKERFNEIKMRLAELSTTFSNNVLDETKAFELIVRDASEVEGVPPTARGMWASSYNANSKAEGEKDATPEEGPWRLTLDGPSYMAAMQHVPSRSVRETMYRGYMARASDLSSDAAKSNVELIYETLLLRQEMSSLLGFANYAELSLSRKMAPSVKSVKELSDLIAEKALPAAKAELQEVFDLAKSKGGAEYEAMEALAPWDVSFWSERLKESKFDLTEEELRPYFALPKVLDGMFDLVKRIFGVEVRKVDLTKAENDEDVQVWHPDVQFFHVHDIATDKHVASFYLDPYSRPEDKRGGAWMDVCIGKSEACGREIPVAYLTCNGSPPVGDTQPSLMTFREVETLFHEFGHGLQHMLTDATVGDVAGINGVEWDAVELPSQFMENWCYDRATVYGFAKHWETNEPLPDEMFEKLKAQKTFNAGLMACRQLHFGMLDMELHSNYNANNRDQESILDVQRRIAAQYTPHAMPIEEDRFLCSFSHIFAGGYAAGYYSYKWAEVMSADAFGAFEDVGLENKEQVAQVGRKFRETVLGLGGGVEPMKVFRQFRGREPTPDALLRHNGLA